MFHLHFHYTVMSKTFSEPMKCFFETTTYSWKYWESHILVELRNLYSIKFRKKSIFEKKTFFFEESFAVDFFPIQTKRQNVDKTFFLPKKRENRLEKKSNFRNIWNLTFSKIWIWYFQKIVSGIWKSLIWLWRFDFRLKEISVYNQTTVKRRWSH